VCLPPEPLWNPRLREAATTLAATRTAQQQLTGRLTTRKVIILKSKFMEQYRKLKRAMKKEINPKNGIKTVLLTVFIFLSLTTVFAQDIVWKKNFGGSGADAYYSVTVVSDGVIAVGCSQYFGIGDWEGVTGKGNYDAIIVKYDNVGNVKWKKNFGGSDFDYFYSVTTVSDGIIAVGDSWSIGTGDWAGIQGKGSDDAVIVKFDNNGNVVWKKNFGGSGQDRYDGVTTVSDGIIAVGTSEYKSFGNGDWVGVTGQIDNDAIIVKYDFNGNLLWKKSYGTNYRDWFESVTAVSDGIVAVGHKYTMYMGTSYNDVVIVKYDNSGNILWNKTLNNNEGNSYYSVATISDGVIAVGQGNSNSIIVKYDNNGNIVWKKYFSGSYECVKAVSDGEIVAGYASISTSGDTGDWAGFTGRGATDAILVKYDFNGNIVWKKQFGGQGYDEYHSVVAVSDGIIAVGESYALLGSGSSFGNSGNLWDVEGKGVGDAIIVKYIGSNTGIRDVSKVSNFKIYPNPSNNCIFIECENFYTVKLYDTLGKEVLTQNANGKVELNISHLSNGIYIVTILSEDKVIGYSKVVKQ